jgi:hypothetical protein
MTCIKHKIEFEIHCPQCLESPLEHDFPSPPPIPLTIALESLYGENKNYRISYISDLDGNLTRIHRHFNECVDLTSLGTTITLTTVAGCSRLIGGYDYVFIDNDILGKEAILSGLKLPEHVKIQVVDPSKQTICL